MLVTAVEALELEPADQKVAYQTIARYCAKLCDCRQFAREIHQLSPHTRRELQHWRQWAENSYYWSVLWRVLVKGRSPVKWNVLPDDVFWVHSHLKRWDRSRLRKIVRKKLVPTKRFKATTLNTITKTLMSYCKRLTWRKLRFIYTYDNGVCQEDLTMDLMEYALKAVRRQEPTGDRLLATNHGKRAAHNRMVNLISHYTAQKRARLSAVGDAFREYEVKVISSDATPGLDAVASQSTPDSVVWRIANRLGPDHEHYARCVLGMMPDFDEWVRCWYQRDPQNMPPNELGELARGWVGIRQDVLREQLGGML